MKKGIIITLPRWDNVTEYLSAFSREIINIAQKSQIPIKLIEREDVRRNTVESFIISMKYKMLIFNGHGAQDYICGHKNEKIISLGINEELLKGRIIYARSCWSLIKLGESMKEDKDGCFIGYIFPFQFIVDKTWVSNPSKDNIAKIFFDTSNLVPIGLIKGNTAKESNENSKNNMLKMINKILKSGETIYQVLLEPLWNNYTGQKIIGNEDERLI